MSEACQSPATKPLQHFARWTVKDDETLRYMWWEASIAQIARKLDRTPSAIYGRAKVLGLPLGVPHGWETLAAARRRTGYEERTIELVFDFVARLTRKPFGGRPIRLAMSDIVCPRESRKRHRIVDQHELDEAIAIFHQTEFVGTAALRAGMHSRRLKRLLVARGQLVQWGRGHRHRAWIADIEQAILDAKADTERLRRAGSVAGGLARQRQRRAGAHRASTGTIVDSAPREQRA